MIAERVKACLAMMVIGEGVLAVVEPRQYLRLWKSGPPWLRAIVEPFEDRPNLTRCLGAGEVALGVWFAMQQGKSRSEV